MSKEMELVCDNEVEALLSKRAIFEVEDDSQGFLSALFVIPKNAVISVPSLTLNL